MKVYTADKAHPRVVIEIRVDEDLLVACVKDEEIDPAEVSRLLEKAVASIVKAMHKGIAKRKSEQAE